MKTIVISSLILSICIVSSNAFTNVPIQCNSDVRTKTTLFGLSNVNDYFNSFNSKKNNDDEAKSNNPGQGSAYVNINDYFNSFNKPTANQDSSDKWHGNDNFGLNTYNEDNQHDNDAKSTTFFPKKPPVHMTLDEIEAYNDARLCPKMLLTQSAIQSFCYLLEECRDPHSGKWIQDFLEVQGLQNYHGNGAFNITRYPTWDTLLLDLIRQPNEKMIVSAKRRGRGHGGWSKNNPYLKERWVEYAIDIRPASLVQRLLPVREQLSKEFERDLNIVQTVDSMIMDSYFNQIKTTSLEDSSNKPTFERISVQILSNMTEFQDSASSPFRKGNFDLLYSLCTHASAHVLLRQLRDESYDEVTYEWFRNFYTKHVSEYFDGDQAFGRADDFIDALLRTPPSFKEAPGTGAPCLIDPMAFAEKLIGIRSEIAEEFKYVMTETKEDHMWLNDQIIRAMMGKAIAMSKSVDERVEITEEINWGSLDDVGAFE